MLVKHFNRWILKYFSYFSQKTPEETICMKCQSLFSGKNRNIISLMSAELAHGVVKVNCVLSSYSWNFSENCRTCVWMNPIISFMHCLCLYHEIVGVCGVRNVCIYLLLRLGCTMRKHSLGIWGQRRPRSACTSVQSDPGLPCSLIQAFRAVWSRPSVQSDPGLHCPLTE